MIYTYFITLSRETYVKTYVARITGSHPRFVFNREFLEKRIKESEGKRHFYVDIGRHGVFEQCIKVFEKHTNRIISYERKYFVYRRRKIQEIKREEVLEFLANMNLRYLKKQPDKKAS